MKARGLGKRSEEANKRIEQMEEMRCACIFCGRFSQRGNGNEILS